MQDMVQDTVLTIMGKRKADLSLAVKFSLEQAKTAGVLDYSMIPDFVIEVPKDLSFGDFATNAAMLLAKEAKKAPREIAKIILTYFPKEKTGVDSLEIAGPGFINFRMQKGWLSQCLNEILTQGMRFGQSSAGGGRKVQVEFVSANPTGELHMGNARGAAIGDTLANLLKLAGFDAKKEFYVNDAGNQIEKFGLSLEARYFQLLGREVPFPEDGYHGQDIQDTMKLLISEEGDKYLEMEEGLRRELLTAYALEKKLISIRENLKKFGVEYDVWFSEQSLYDSGSVAEVVERLQQKGYVYEKEQALWLEATRFGEEKDEVLVRSNGVPTYYAADIAYHENKFQRGFEKIINVWGADHHGHVARMKGAMEFLGHDRDAMEVILMQLVHLHKDGELVRMSKRTGTYVTLEELMEDVGKDAARFFFVMRSPDSQMDFDLDLAISQTADNPVFYVQYAHARICSLLSLAAEEGYVLDGTQADTTLLNHPSEEMLIRKMADYPDEVIFAAEHLEPHRIAVYVQELASAFHNFYGNCRVVSDDKKLSLARLALSKGVADIIKSSLGAMGVTAPQKM